MRHVVYSSLAFAGAYQHTSVAEVMQAHLDTERHLAELAATSAPARPFTYTAIREGLYAESTPIYTAFFDPRHDSESEICIPHDGSGPGVAWVKRDELGEASSKVIAQIHTALTTSGSEGKVGNAGAVPFANRTLLLTGPKVWSLAETVEVLGRIAGRGVRIREVTVDEYIKQPKVLSKFGSKELAETWATAWKAIRAGETAVVTRELGAILGRAPEEFEIAAKKHFV